MDVMKEMGFCINGMELSNIQENLKKLQEKQD